MRTYSSHARRLIVLGVAFAVLLAGALSAPSTRAAQVATWQAWTLSIDFPNQQPQVIYTVYTGTNDPDPQIIDSVEIDISAGCIVQGGPLTYDQNGYAVFNGAVYIECPVPSWRSQLAIIGPHLPGAHTNTLTCDAGQGPLFVAADVKLDPLSGSNPIVDASDLGMLFSLPSNGSKARTAIGLTSGTLASPQWSIGTGSKRMLLGENGPAIVEAADHFGWLNFLTSTAWQGFFENVVTGSTIGHWVESPSSSWSAPAGRYKLKTLGSVVYIGHNASTGANLHGRLASGMIDPGCKTS